ncbi:MAG: aspartyl/asparaginyl beta-hydroxylase domain-containing protein, partial [Dokdonella sp.]
AIWPASRRVSGCFAMDFVELTKTARAHAERGEIAAARQLYSAWLERDPEAIEPLGYLGRLALVNNELPRSIELLERATKLQPDHAEIMQDLGIAYRRAQRVDEAMLTLQHAVDIDPSQRRSRLHLGAIQESRGETHVALVNYFAAVSNAQGQGLWRSRETTPTPLLPMVEHAIAVIERERPKLLDRSIAPLRDRYGRDALQRVEQSLAMYLEQIPTTYADPRQKPTFLYFPGLPTTPWFERALFPWYEELESRWNAIREELLTVIDDRAQLVPFLDSPVNIQGLPFMGSTGASASEPQWDAYFFHRHGVRYNDHCARCPITATALDAAPIVRIRDHAPECLYSVLSPGAHILPHRGVTNTRTVTHLPLIVPGNGALCVAGEARAWQEGRCFSFDDTFLHEAWNHSDQTRVILLLDSWNPHMTEVEQLAISELVAAIGDFSKETNTSIPGDSDTTDASIAT